MNRKVFLPLVITIIGLTVLSACAAAAPASGSTSAANTNTAQSADSDKLVIGTIMLEKTDQKVDAAQAAELLPLWKAVKSLSTSDTASDAEVSALYSQIQSAMSAEQLKTINASDYSNTDVEQLLSSLGIGSASQDSNSSNSSRSSTAGQGGMPAGGAGGPPDGGGMPAGGFPAGAASSASASTQNSSGASLPSMSSTSQYLDALIAMLKTKIPS